MIRARDIADLCDDLGLERASVTVKEGWSHDEQFFLTFGPMAYRQTMEISPKLDMDAVKAKLEAARGHPLSGASFPSPEAKSPPAATPAPAKGKRKKTNAP
jgi:hypothetical protein